MFGRALRTVLRAKIGRSLSVDAAVSNTVKLNFSLPHETIYDGASVHSVIIPGSAGEYGVTASHVPYVAQLKPGVLQILHEENSSDPEKYFVAGGYALTHADSSTVSCLPKTSACFVSFGDSNMFRLFLIN
jgi:F-type H+-transporting ATPase subunit delta